MKVLELSSYFGAKVIIVNETEFIIQGLHTINELEKHLEFSKLVLSNP